MNPPAGRKDSWRGAAAGPARRTNHPNPFYADHPWLPFHRYPVRRSIYNQRGVNLDEVSRLRGALLHDIPHMKDHVECYVAHKRSLGFRYEREERVLNPWATTAMSCGQDIICADTMIRWAQQASSIDEARRRLAIGRRFALWLRTEDEHHEIPHMECLGRRQRHTRAPILLSDDQIRGLMEAALQLSPAGSITPHTMYCIIGLIAVTGLRRAEACALRLSDITEDGLLVRETKFAKSRLVPVLDSTRDALQHYLGHRKNLGAASDNLFCGATVLVNMRDIEALKEDDGFEGAFLSP